MTAAHRVTLLLLASVLTVTSCTHGDSDASTALQSKGSAFCSDLKAGDSPFQILGAQVKDGTYTAQQAAAKAYGWAKDSCPDELTSNDMLRTYLQNWHIDPDR